MNKQYIFLNSFMGVVGRRY